MNEEYMSDIGSAHRLFPDDTLKKDMHEPKQHHAMSSYSLNNFPLNRMHLLANALSVYSVSDEQPKDCGL